MIRKNTINVVGDSVIAPVSLRPLSSSNDFIPQCYSDSLKHPKRMTGKFVSFCQHSNNVNNNHFLKVGKRGSMLQKGFNDHHIKNTCFVSAIFWEFLLLLIFVNNNLFSDRYLVYSSNRAYDFSIAHFFCTDHLKLFLVITEQVF